MKWPVIADAVLFDLDGTLVDTAPDLAAAVNYLRMEHQLEALPVSFLRPHVSRGAAGMLREAFPEASDEKINALVASLLIRYEHNIAEQSALFDGMSTVLQLLDADDVPWGVVTNKAEYLAHQLLDRLGLTSRCKVLIGGDTLPFKKPDPAPLNLACEYLGVSAKNVPYLGDDVRDIQAAHAAGMPAIAVNWGYGHRWEGQHGDTDSNSAPHAVLHHPTDLFTYVQHP